MTAAVDHLCVPWRSRAAARMFGRVARPAGQVQLALQDGMGPCIRSVDDAATDRATDLATTESLSTRTAPVSDHPPANSRTSPA